MLGALDGCDEILVDIRRTSRMWGSPFAYLRAWLLEFECARLRGDLEEAAALSHVVQWKAEIMGVTHPASLELALAASKTNQLCAREQDAREFAGELWLTLRRLEHPPFEPLRALAELYDAWGELSRVRAIATLLRKTYPEHEASLLRWLRGVIVRYHESERDGIDARLAELDESS